MKSIQNIEVEIIEEFSMFDSWIDKYDYLIDLGKSLEILKDEFNFDLGLFKYFAGHSLGEYSALVCSGSLDFTDAIYL